MLKPAKIFFKTYTSKAINSTKKFGVTFQQMYFILKVFHSENTSYNKSADALQQIITGRLYQDVFPWLATVCCRQVCCKLSAKLLPVDCQHSSVVSTSCNNTQMTSCFNLMKLNNLEQDCVRSYLACIVLLYS